MRTLVTFLIALIACTANAKEGDDLIGTKAPNWNLTNWINSPALQLEELRGKVVLVRWWTAPECPYCKASAPALNEFHAKYAARGLQVLGNYHHKSDEPLDFKDVKRYAEKYKFRFPVAVDPDWQTLNEWWLRKGEQRWTSVTFLLDPQGVIRFIHPGGQYTRGDNDYEALESAIKKVLREKNR